MSTPTRRRPQRGISARRPLRLAPRLTLSLALIGSVAWMAPAGALSAAPAPAATPAPAGTGPHFIHGSWVKVRTMGDAGAPVSDHLVSNTPVLVLARAGAWCQLSYGAGKAGFVDCQLLGPQALSLSQAATEPARAFWIAPSPKRLAAYGQALPRPASLRLEQLKKTLQFGDTVRYPAVPEFEAAKRLMKAGVALNPAHELARGAAVDMAAELRELRIRPAAIRPSFFREQASVALVSEADADGLAAVAGSKISLAPSGLPTAWYSRHMGPEIEGISGFWDVGAARLTLTPALPLYSVAANGLVGASALSSLPFNVGGEGHYCGAQYSGNSLDPDKYMAAPFEPGRFDFQLLTGYPVLKQGTEVLARFTLAQPLPSKSVRIKTQAQPVQLPDLDRPGDLERLKWRKSLKPQVILRELDLDGDGVADLMQLETPLQYGEISLDLVLRRNWYLNIQGQWFRAGQWEDEDCT